MSIFTCSVSFSFFFFLLVCAESFADREKYSPFSLLPPLIPACVLSCSIFTLFATGIVVTDLGTSSDDEAEVVDEAPKLPRSVLQALLRGSGHSDPPIPGLLSSPVLPQLAPPPRDYPPLFDLDLGSLSESGVDEAMDMEQ